MTKFEQIVSVLPAGTFAEVHKPITSVDPVGDGSNYGNPVWAPAFVVAGYAGQKCFDYGSKACDDYARKRVHFTGGGHYPGNPIPPQDECATHFVYDELTDQFTKVPFSDQEKAAAAGSNSHSYQLQTVDSVNGKYYHSWGNSNDIRQFDINKTNPVDIGPTSTELPTAFIGPGIGRGCLEYFPERNSLIWLTSGGGAVYEKGNSSDWVGPIFSDGVLAGDGKCAIYNPISKSMLIGGGTTNVGWNFKFWLYKSDGQMIPVPDCPVKLYFAGWSLIAADVATGKWVAFTSDDPGANGSPTKFIVVEFDPVAMAWTQRPDIAANVPLNMGGVTGSPYQLFDVVLTSLKNHSAFFFLGFKTYLYKHTTTVGPGPDPTPEPEPVPPGVTLLSKWFSSGGPAEELRYAWNGADADLNAALAGKPHYAISTDRSAGEGNAFACKQVSGVLSIPEIENGALKFTVPAFSGQQVGFFQDNFTKVLGNPSQFIAPGSPLGAIVYLQFKLKINDAMLDTTFQEYSALIYYLSTPAAGSTTLKSANSEFTSAMQGRKIALTGDNMTWGIYTVIQFVDAATVVLDRAPCLTAPGTGGVCEVAGSAQYNAGGWKVIIHFGNPPFGSSASAMEITMNDGYQRNFPQMYGQIGTDGPAALNDTVPWKRNVFQEVTIRIEVRGTTNAPESLVQWWIDGVQAGNWGTAKIKWGGSDGAGLGQFQLTPFHTRKDPTQDHPAGYMWFKDLIISNRPIPLNGTPDPGPIPPVPIPVLVKITNPLDGHVFKSNSTSVTAKVLNPVIRAELWVDEKLKGVQEEAPLPLSFNVDWIAKVIPKGTHVLEVRVYDAAGATGKASISVTRQ